MHCLVGTSGYSYKEWRGKFYPEDLPAAEMLASYAQRLRTVEINNTFYRMPKSSVFESWRQQVPPDFRFSIKASRRITHIKRLRDVEEETRYLERGLRLLGEQLGIVLFQCPPNMRYDGERLRRFLELLPQDVCAALEFRHASWFEHDVSAVLREFNATLCIVDDEDADGQTGFDAIGARGYLRLRRQQYSTAALRRWAKMVAGADWEGAYLFFKHEDESAGPNLAVRLQEMFDKKL